MNKENEFWLDYLQFQLDLYSKTIYNSIPTILNDIKELKRELKILEHKLKLDNDISKNMLIITFKIKELTTYILKNLLEHIFKINLPLYYINNFLNNINEYIKFLEHFNKTGIILTQHCLELNKIWLKNSIINCCLLIDKIDDEKYKKELNNHKNNINNLYDKCINYLDYYNHTKFNFPAIKELNYESILEIKSFNNLLHKLFKLKINKYIFSEIDEFTIYLMFRCCEYHLSKLN